LSGVTPPAPAGAQPADARGDVAQIVEQASEALTACKRPVERRYSPRKPRILVMNPRAENRTEEDGEPLRA
jgi:hypothetical protein